MKCIVLLIVLMVTMGSCSREDELEARAMRVRELVCTKSVTFTARVRSTVEGTGESFTLDCEADCGGDVRFSVVQPECISGIQGSLSGTGGKLLFDTHAVAFSMLANGRASPISAPWLLMKTLRAGYIHAWGVEKDLLRLTIMDSYHEDALQMDIWFTDENVPVQSEVIWRNTRILTMEIDQFRFL